MIPKILDDSETTSVYALNGAPARTRRVLGGSGSGNFGHAGRPGQVGGSSTEGTTPEGQAGEDWDETPDLGEFRAYHGTTEEAWTTIQKEGLIPHKSTGADILASVPEYVMNDGTRKVSVYMSEKPVLAATFAEFVAREKGVDPLILHVHVPNDQADKIHTDEELTGAVRFVGSIPPEWIHRTDLQAEKVKGKLFSRSRKLGAATYTSVYAVIGCQSARTLGGPGSGHFGHSGGVGGPGNPGGSTSAGTTTKDLDAREAKIIAEAVTPEERTYARRLAEAELKLEAEVKGGDSKDANTVGGVYTAERLAVHDHIIQQYFIDRAKAGEMLPRDLPNPHMIMMAGAPGAGKTTARSELDLKTYVVADSDQMKEYLRPYGYNGDNAIKYQRETSDLSAKLVEFARQNHMNVLIDRANRTTGSVTDPAGTFDGALGQLAAFRKAGYSTEYRFVSVPLEVSIGRAVDRYIKTGRYVPMSFIRDTMFDKNKNSYPEQSFRRSVNAVVKGRSLVDRAFIFDGVTQKSKRVR